MDWKLELVNVPVSDVDRAKAFYAEQVGFHLDNDVTVSDEVRFIQLTPPGSACSISMGKGLTDGEPGSVRGLQLVVHDVHAARADLLERGVEVRRWMCSPGGRSCSSAIRTATPGPSSRSRRARRRRWLCLCTNLGESGDPLLAS